LREIAFLFLLEDMGDSRNNIIEIPELRERVQIFHNRQHAGEILAGMLESFKNTDSLILAIPSGGVPVGAAIARILSLPFDVAVVSKITLPWNTEAGYGAVAFDGTIRLNEELLPHLRLTPKQIETGKELTLEKVHRRLNKFRSNRPFPEVSNRRVLLVDDGLASGFTLLVAVEALRKAGASILSVVVPTGSQNSTLKVSRQVEALYCANIRSGWGFAVASAYQRWTDVPEEEALEVYNSFFSNSKPTAGKDKEDEDR
jgi:putative phosphoribosyl transferase